MTPPPIISGLPTVSDASLTTIQGSVNTTGHNATTTTNTTTEEVFSAAVRDVVAVALAVVMAVGVLGNGLLCVLVYRKAAMRSAINLLVAHLALSDLLLSALVMPFSLAGLFLPAQPGTWGRPLCGLQSFLHEALVTLNTCLLLVISLDRCLIIVHRQDKLNVRRARGLIAGTWVFSLLSSAPPLLGWGPLAAYPGVSQCASFAVLPREVVDVSFVAVSCLVNRYAPLVAILYSYARIVSTVREKSRKVHHYCTDLGVSHRGGTTVPPTSPRPRTSVTAALSDLSRSARTSTVSDAGDGWCVANVESPHMEGSGVTSSVSSSSSVSFVSSSSTVHLHSVCCVRLVEHLRVSASALPGPCSACSSAAASRPGVQCACTCSSSPLPQNGAIDSKHTHKPGVPRDLASNESSFVPRKNENDHNRELQLLSSSYPASCLHKAVNRSTATRSYLSSPSGFPPTASRLRRTAEARRQVLDMSFKTRSFQTILILSLLLFVCWMPYVTAALVTSLQQTSPQYHHGHLQLLCLLLWLGFLKSALNPIVYCFRIRKFREFCKVAVPRACYSCRVPGWLGSKMGQRRVNPSAVYQCGDNSVP